MGTQLRHLTARLLAFVRGGRLDREFAQELDSHLEMLTEDNIARGLPPAEARRQAAIRLGGAASLQAHHREARGFRALDDLAQDLRFAVRLIVKERWVSAAAIAAIALGIGANTVGFTIINAAYFRGFAFERAEELHSISWVPTRGRRLPSSVPDLEDWRSGARSFTALAASRAGAVNISDDHAGPEQTRGASITANLFDVLRQRPLLGRTFVAGEDQRGAEPVVIIGYDLWRTRFNLDQDVVGRTLRVNGRGATIAGVMPEGMKFPDDSELWVPFVAGPEHQARDRRLLSVFGRLAPGVTREQAAAEVDGIARRILAAHPELTRSAVGGQVETLNERFLNGSAPRMFVTIMGAVIFVLLIACANVATLLLSRVIDRSREVAVRFAVGATRWRVLRQLLIESVTLAGLGGVAGLALAAAGVGAFDAAIRASGAPYWLRFTIDYRVLFYVAATCVGAGVLFGLVPALQVSRQNPHDTLKDGARGTVGRGRSARVSHVLVVAELALTVVLLCGAGLMLRSFMALYTMAPGFEAAGLSRMRLQLPPTNYPTAETRLRFFDQLLPRVAAIPGIERAAFTTAVPPLDHEEWRIELEGARYAPDEPRPWTSTVLAMPGYLDTLGVALTRGRALTPGDHAPGATNVLINEAFAERFFPGEDPIGRRLRFMARDDEAALVESWVTIAGVTAPFLQGSINDAFRSPVVFLPFAAAPPYAASVLVRSVLPPAAVMAAVRDAVRTLDADQPVFAIETVTQVIAGERTIHRIFATLFAVLAVVGLALSAVGVYGVMAYAVTQRTQEIGVRLALGANRRQVSWMFLKRSLVQLAIGLGVGLPVALALAGVARLSLVGIEPADPATFGGITLVLAAVALAACLIPVRRAARVDPANALRAE